eukprot:757043-Rhodomonas_salina.1
MTRKAAGRQYVKTVLNSTAYGMDDYAGRHFLRGYSCTFPTQNKLSKMGKVDSQDCLFCPGIHEHM